MVNTIADALNKAEKDKAAKLGKKNWTKVIHVTPEGFYSEKPKGRSWYHESPKENEEYSTSYIPRVRQSSAITVGLAVLSKVQSRIDKSYHSRMRKVS